MSGYIGSKAVSLSTTGADINGNANVDGTLDVTGAFTSLGIDDNAAVPAVMGTRSVPDYQGVDYSKLTPILTAALQEALNKIDALEARLTALEATL